MRRSLQTGRASSNAVLGLASLGLIAIPLASLTADLVILPEETFHGAFVGGPTGKPSDTTLNNAVQPSLLTAGRSFDVPSGSKPSPLFGAQPFTQRMLLLEEFGTKPIQSGGGGAAKVLSQPNSNRHCIEGRDVDSFLRQPMYPAPSRTSNTIDRNPLRPVIESTLARECETAPCEGRPGGEDFAHQRWAEFQPQVFVESALAGSHPNSGMRDAKQRHGYAVGEFAPGGLYHNTAGAPGFEGTTAGIRIKLHPNMPEQDPLAVWTFDGTLPLKLLQARYGETILFRNHNMLPVDPSANRGFGLHTITTHEHNGHNPAESDGFANAFFFPGQYYDYRWPMILAGHDSINTDASDPRAGSPDGNGGIHRIRGDWRETMSTHWFHDHMVDYTSQNVYKGNAAMMNYYSAIDRGNEAINDGVNLRLPSGSALDWGNRDYDVNLCIADKATSQDGQLWMNPFQTNGFLGDILTTNVQYKPFFEVRARKYRFRILNGCVARFLKIGLVDQNNNPVPMYLVANDGNIMEHAVALDGTLGSRLGELPEQSIAERFDVIIDFSRFTPGSRLYFVNMLEHQNGAKPSRSVPLRNITQGTYRAITRDNNRDGIADEWINGDPCVGKFLEFRVQSYSGTDLSMNPADYVEGRQQMIPLWRPTQTELASAIHRTFEFGRGGGTDGKPWTIKADGGQSLGANMSVVSACPNIDQLSASGMGHIEVWTIKNGGNGWSHPVHVHFEEGIILSMDGQAPRNPWKWARKDMYRIGPVEAPSEYQIAIHVREFAGTYVEHCHNTTHEDNAMLLRWDSMRAGQLMPLATPIPTWDGCEFVATTALPTALSGDGIGARR
jgi:FtsP/CotA-like multicopper oxidase with cupredoxin domain